MTPAPIVHAKNELRRRPCRWLVTGGAGFIGSHLVEALLMEGQRVRVMDNFSTGGLDNLNAIRARVSAASWRRFELVIGDVRDRARCELAVRDVDVVLHHAAFVSVPGSMERPGEAHAVNVDGTVNVLLAARAAAVTRVVLASSSAVYGDQPDVPLREGMGGVPGSPYAASKAAAEAYVAAFHRAFGLPCVALRYFNVVGARQSAAYGAVVPRWTRMLAEGRRPTIHGDGTTTRDFCPVGNVVEANILAAMAPAESMGRCYNIACGTRTSLVDLAEILRTGMARRGYPCADIGPVFGPVRAGDIKHSCADITLARSVLGYRADVGLAEGLETMMDAIAGTPRSDVATVAELPPLAASP